MDPSRLRAIAAIAVFDVGLPLALYYGLTSAGLSNVTALLLSGVFPAAKVTAGFIRQRRIEVVGAVVLAGILLGTVLGLVSHNAKFVIIEGSVPTGVFGVSCLLSLRERPLMYGLAREFAGPDSPQGQQMARLWQRYEEYRHVFRVITAVWGAGFLLEAAVRVVITWSVATGTALFSSMAMPVIWAGLLSAWTVGYGTYRRKTGEREAAAAGVVLDPGPGDQDRDREAASSASGSGEEATAR